ncbi:MAG: cyclic nucleotide-binding domain-containing protein [Bacteroides sp.]|nr:cyclic nucleotide-binding domain-containing protein [Bacteroides sp.]MCM1095335.1 cyclic nucleotide-binding domain-containing protein [Terasakiella sp.]
MSAFNQFHDRLPLDALRQLMRSEGRSRRYARGDVFLKSGDICGEVAMVRSGYLKYVVADTSGAECVVGFTFEGEFASYLSSALFHTPLPVSVVAGRSTEALVVPAESVMALESFMSDAMPVLFDALYARFLDSYRYSPAERYARLCAAHPEVIQKVPLREIASYLRVSPTHLSRIRREMVKVS